MHLLAALALVARSFALGGPTASPAASKGAEHGLANAGVLPILDIGTAYILGQSPNNASFRTFLVDGPIQCGPDKPCLDESCCNSDGKCGFKEYHCKPKDPVKCISNCDAKAMCGVDSKDGNKKCGLNLCCSYYGWCGTNSTHCSDKDDEGQETPCQRNFGGCEQVPPPSCGSGSGSASGGRHIAYYQSWNTRDRSCNRIWPDRIRTANLTHLNFAFADINPHTFQIQPHHPEDVDLMYQFTKLKTDKLQTWIAVGGWEFSDPGPTRKTWSDMVSKKENRAAFIDSAIKYMAKYGFQGLDLDWEYPATVERGGQEADTENQVALVKEMRQAFGDKYGISSVLAPDYWYLRGMDPKAMESSVDWFNFMGYDLHGAWDADVPTLGAKIRPHTDLREIDKDLLPLWFAKIDPKKVNFGMALYGRGYTATKKDCLQMSCDFSGPSHGGNCTKFDGFLSNYEISRMIKEKNLVPELMKDSATKQFAWDDQWIGYDDEETRNIKVAYANDRCLGGTFFWAIDYDSGKGTGNKPNGGSGSSNDVYVDPGIFYGAKPSVRCYPPCTLVFPPYKLPKPTTIRWPPITTTLLTIEGGETRTKTTEYETRVGGVVTKITTVVLTVAGGSEKEITTTISIPPITTDRIDFWPISVERTDDKPVTFNLPPRVFPPQTSIALSGCVLGIWPTHNPNYLLEPDETDRDWPEEETLCFTGTHMETIQPQPTHGIKLPSGCQDCTESWCPPTMTAPPECDNFWCSTPTATTSSDKYCFPTSITWGPGKPPADCKSDCGHKLCDTFGCPPGNEEDGGGDGGDGGDDDDADDGDDDDGGGGKGGKKKCKGKNCKGKKCKGSKCKKKPGKKPGPKGIKGGNPPGPPPPPGIDPPNGGLDLGCGEASCDGGCGTWGCGGGCGVKGCGGNCVGDNCAPCPLEECGGLECAQKNKCGPYPIDCDDNGGAECGPNPTGGPPSKPDCDEKAKTTVTDYYVSCTKTETRSDASKSCKTVSSITYTACNIQPTTITTTRGPSCTRAPLMLDDDEGDNEGDPNGPIDPECKQCDDFMMDCKNKNCKDKETIECMNNCRRELCNGGSPEICHKDKKCAIKDCPADRPTECKVCLDWIVDCYAKVCPDDPRPPSKECREKCTRDLCYSDKVPDMCHKGQKCALNVECPEEKPKPPITQNWKIRLHQIADKVDPLIYWTLVDSNGDEAGKGMSKPQGGSPIDSTRDSQKLPNKVWIVIDKPEDKDRTEVIFQLDEFYEQEKNKRCSPMFWTGQSTPKGSPGGTHECKEGGARANEMGCWNVKMVEWRYCCGQAGQAGEAGQAIEASNFTQASNATAMEEWSYERFFECFFKSQPIKDTSA